MNTHDDMSLVGEYASGWLPDIAAIRVGLVPVALIEEHVVSGQFNAHERWPHVPGQYVWLVMVVGVGCLVPQLMPLLDFVIGVLELVVVAEEVCERAYEFFLWCVERALQEAGQFPEPSRLVRVGKGLGKQLDSVLAIVKLEKNRVGNRDSSRDEREMLDRKSVV